MKITVNGKELETSARTLYHLREAVSPGSDVLIYNGFAVKEDVALEEGATVGLITRGQLPPEEELEALLVSRHTPDVHCKVKAAKVAVVGLGGLGSHIAVALARTGVGNLLLVDFDVVEPSNLNRQHYFIRHIGMDKTEAMAEILGEINPFIKTETRKARIDAGNVSDLLGGYDIVVEAFDNPQSKAELVSTVLSKLPGTTVVCASGMAGYESANAITTKKLGTNIYMCGDGVNEARIGQGLMAPRVLVCAGHEATMVLRLILGEMDA